MYCEWLNPCYVAVLPLIVYEPLSLSCLEYSAGGTCFLQLILENSSPLPLLLKDPLLCSEAEVDKLYGNLPEVCVVMKVLTMNP